MSSASSPVPFGQSLASNASNDERSLLKESHSTGDLVAPSRRQESGLDLPDMSSIRSALKKTRSGSPSSARVLFSDKQKSPRVASFSSLKSSLQPPQGSLSSIQNLSEHRASTNTILSTNQPTENTNASTSATALADKITTLVRENDLLLDQLRQRDADISNLQSSLSKLSPHEFENLKNQNHVLKEHMEQWNAEQLALEQEIKECRRELSLSQSECDQWKSDLKTKLREIESLQTKLSDSKKALSELSNRYDEQLKESAAATARERDLIEEIRIKSAEQEASHGRITDLLDQNASLNSENEKLITILKVLETKVKQFEEKELVTIEETHQRVQEMEEALFQRDKALEREHQLNREIQELNKKLEEMPQFYIQKNQREVEVLRMQYQADRRRHGEEMSKLETLCANLQNQNERAIREKRAAESELEKLTRHIPGETDRLTMTIEELHVKLRASERERNEAVHRLESLTQKLARAQNRFELERSQFTAKADEAYRRLRKTEKDLEEEKGDMIPLLKQLSALQHEKRTLTDLKEKMEVDFENEKNALKQKHQDHTIELTEKLNSVNEAHSRTCREMQQMISDQKRLSDKWKEESAHISEHYEAALSTLRSQIVQHQSRISELESQVQKAVSQRRDLIEQMSEEKKTYATLHNRYVETENRMEVMGRQINMLVSKEAELLESRKMLQRELDKVTLERDRLHRMNRQEKFHDNLSNEKRKEHIAAAIASNLSQDQQSNLQGIKELEMQIERVKQRSRAHQYKDLSVNLESPEDSD